jgi:hypothetical protein
MRWGIGFARPSAGDDEERRPHGAILAHTVFDSAALLGIKLIEICSGCQHGSAPNKESTILSWSTTSPARSPLPRLFSTR